MTDTIQATALYEAADWESTNAHLAETEKALNVADYVPGISTGSAIVRTVVAVMEIIGGLATSAFEGVKTLYFRAKEGKQSENYEAHFEQMTINFAFVKQGLANVVRAAIAAVPVLGNATLLINDKVEGNRFHLATERPAAGVHPMFSGQTAFETAAERHDRKLEELATGATGRAPMLPRMHTTNLFGAGRTFDLGAVPMRGGSSHDAATMMGESPTHVGHDSRQ